MSQFLLLLHKEFREAWRSFKFLWMPLLFIFLGVSDPLTNYFMEDILSAVGNMPEGFSMMMPELAPEDLLLATTGQFQMIGLIIFVVTVTGMISREQQNGTAVLLYVRPVSATAIYMSKLVMALLLGIVSAVCGYAASMYYTAILYGTVDTVLFVQMVATYCLWLLFVSAVCLLFSAIFKTVIAMTVSMILLPIGILIDSIIGQFWHVTPLKLAMYGVGLLRGEMTYYTETVILTVALIGFAILAGIFFIKKWASRFVVFQ